MIIKINDKIPKIHETCFVTETATLIGDITMKEKSSVWFNAVVRADLNSIIIGKYTNIQDGCVLHVSKENGVYIGEYVSIGHNVVIHGCHINDNVLIGMGATILDNVEIGEHSIIAAGTVVPPGKKIPPNSLVMGNPGKIKRETTEEDIKSVRGVSIRYAEKYPLLYSSN